MKRLNHFFIQWLAWGSCSLVLATWLLVGCAPSQAQEQGATTTTVAVVLETTPAISPTATSMPPTDTPVPSQTPAPTNTPIPPTLTPTPTQTPTPVPTLTYVQEGALLQELMSTNEGCQLPCWWGIHLGDTLTSIGQTFSQWGVGPWDVTTSGDEKGYIKLGYYNPETGFDEPHVFSQFYAIEGVVQYMKISGNHESRLFGEAEFVRDWERYFLPTILQTYGKPAQAYLLPGNRMEAGPSNYTLLLYYPELGINISYNFWGTQLENGLDKVCFVLEEVMLINLYLYDPQFAGYWPIPHLLGLGNEEDTWLIENELGMDLQTFYDTYQDPDNLGCVELSR